MGNGFLGVRGAADEAAAVDDRRVTLDAFNETWPIVYDLVFAVRVGAHGRQPRAGEPALRPICVRLDRGLPPATARGQRGHKLAGTPCEGLAPARLIVPLSASEGEIRRIQGQQNAREPVSPRNQQEQSGRLAPDFPSELGGLPMIAAATIVA